MDKGYGVYIGGKFAFQVFEDRQGAELCACVWHCPGMGAASPKQREATFKLRGVRVVPVTIIPSAPTSWPDGGKP